MMKYILYSFYLFVFFSCEHPSQVKENRPNILLIVADDMAYSDLGCFGSEIRTPHIDRLANEGILFTQFHASAQCAPSRAMLLTGTDNHMAGVGRQDVYPNTKWWGKRGYERNLSHRVLPVSQLLQEAGYFTCMSGKWHLGYDSISWPNHKGFDESFGILNGGGSHFLHYGLGVEETDTISLWTHNGERVLYPDGEYSTEFHTNNLLKNIRENKSQGDKPFFAYASYSSPHWPLQVPDDWLDKYKGVYDDGYEVLKEKRFAALKKKGFISEDLELPPYGAAVTPWNELSKNEQKIEARKMELYAAMVENLDHHIGRMRDSLETMGLWNNTSVFFLSDNGGAFRDFYAHAERGKFLRKIYDNSYENMGTATSFVSYGKAWGQSCMVPYKLHKSYMTEGGIIVPAIISGKNISRPGMVNKEYMSIMDLAPTFLELAKVDYRQIYMDRQKPPMRGKSMTSLFDAPKAKVHNEEEIFAQEFYGSIFLQRGNWKIVNYKKPYHPENFELFNLKSDPAEMNDLKYEEEELYAELLGIWETYKADNEILMQDPEEAKKYNY